MNPLLWKAIVEYMQTRRIDTGEYEITDPAGKKYRVRKEGEATTGVEAKRRWANWRMDEFNPADSDYPDEDWKYTEHVGTLKDAKSHILDNFISTTPEGSPIWVELQDKIRQEALKDKSKSRGHSRYGRGGGAIPMDILESKTAPRGLLGPRKRKY